MLKILELFGGIGACSSALKKIGVPFEIVDYVEIDKFAVKSYNAMNGTSFETQDISEWDKDVEVDFIMHGSPCQDFSIAGAQAGGDEGSGTRSSLLYETVRIVKKLKPKYVVWENVKNLLSKNHIHNFENYLKRMEELGYTNYYKILNAKDYGIPQKRERIFTISIRNDIDKDFQFPAPVVNDNLKIAPFLQTEVEEKFFFSEESLAAQKKRTFGSTGKMIDINGLVPTLTAAMGTGGGNIHYFEDPMNDNRVRKFTPRECWRLMGFSDEEFDKAASVNSNSQLYKQAGNSIVVSVLENIFKNLFDFS